MQIQMQIKDRSIVVIVSKMKTNCVVHVLALNNSLWQKYQSATPELLPTTYLDVSQ